MVGIVVVSHSQKLAEGVVELASLMAPETPMKAAGGMDDGGFGSAPTVMKQKPKNIPDKYLNGQTTQTGK